MRNPTMAEKLTEAFQIPAGMPSTPSGAMVSTISILAGTARTRPIAKKQTAKVSKETPAPQMQPLASSRYIKPPKLKKPFEIRELPAQVDLRQIFADVHVGLPIERLEVERTTLEIHKVAALEESTLPETIPAPHPEQLLAAHNLPDKLPEAEKTYPHETVIWRDGCGPKDALKTHDAPQPQITASDEAKNEEALLSAAPIAAPPRTAHQP